MSAVATSVQNMGQAFAGLISYQYFWLFTLLVVFYILARANLRSPPVYIFALLTMVVIVLAKGGFALVPPWLVFITMMLTTAVFVVWLFGQLG